MNSFKPLTFALITLATAASVAFAPFAFAHDGENGKQDSAKSEVKSTSKSASNVMVDINPSGRVHVRGAIVTALSGNTITATTVWGSTKLSWTIVTASSTQFAGKDGKATLADVKVGDTVNLNGSLDSTATGLTVHAQVLRDRSLIRDATR